MRTKHRRLLPGTPEEHGVCFDMCQWGGCVLHEVEPWQHLPYFEKLTLPTSCILLPLCRPWNWPLHHKCKKQTNGCRHARVTFSVTCAMPCNWKCGDRNSGPVSTLNSVQTYQNHSHCAPKSAPLRFAVTGHYVFCTFCYMRRDRAPLFCRRRPP